MKRIAFFLLCAAFAAGVHAAAPEKASIVVHLKNGNEVASDNVRRIGSDIAVTVLLGAGRSETRYPAASITRIDFPQPAGIAQAEKSLATGDSKAALAAVSPVVAQQSGFREIPGNWWARAVAVKIKALVAAGNYGDAEKELDALSKVASADDLRSARLQIASAWVAQGNPGKALPVFEDAIAQSRDPEVLAQAWVGKGNAALASKDYDAALLAFLRVPVFFHQCKAVMPQALLGAGRAYVHVDESSKARETFQEILSTYPHSPSAAAAKKELDQLGGDAS